MGLTALRLALEAWVRHPREMAMVNGAWVLAVATPLPLAFLIPWAPLRLPALVLALLWLWLGSGALAAACAQLLSGRGLDRRELLAWLWRHAVERIAALGVGVLGALWVTVAIRFYVSLKLAPWVGLPVAVLVGALGAWLGLALLASIGLAALGPAPWRTVWKASALMPLAFWPSWMAAGFLALMLSGLPALLVGLKHWSAAILLAPLLLSPFFTAAFFAAFLVLLAQGLLERAAGREGPIAPEWRELWSPWR